MFTTMQLLTNCLLSLFSLIFLLQLSLSSPSSTSKSSSPSLSSPSSTTSSSQALSSPSSTSLSLSSPSSTSSSLSLSSPSSSSTDGSSDALLHERFAEKISSIATEPPILEGSLDPLSCDAARTALLNSQQSQQIEVKPREIKKMDKMEDLKILAEQWMHRGIEFVKPKEDTLFAFIVVVLASIIITLFDCLLPPKKQNIILFSGLSGSGKTVLFNQLRDVSVHQGAVRPVETIGGTIVLFTKITMSGRTEPVHLVDFPVDPRLRSILEEYLHRVTAVVFVVDAVEFLRNCQAASEYLYEILTNAGVVKNRIPVLLCCNKTDRVTAHSKEFIRKEMEKEIEKLRVLRSTISTTLGIKGKTFSFSHCRNGVTVAESSGLTGETDQIQKFIRNHV